MHGGFYTSCVVQDADEESKALAEGWSLTTVEAKERHETREEDARQKDEEARKEVLIEPAPLYKTTPPPEQPKRGPGRPPKVA